MVSKFRQWDYIAELEFTGGTVYVSKHGEVTWGGHTYEPRIQKVEGLSGIFIDRRSDTFPELTLTLDNIPTNWSGTFPFHSKDAAASFEDRAVRVYRYDRTSGEAVLRWHGLLKRPDFDPKEISVTLSATNYLDSIETDIPIITLSPRCPYAFGGSSVETAGGTVPSVGCPYATYGIPGFTTCGKTLEDCTERGMERFFGGLTHIAPTLDGEDNNFVDRGKVRESRAPIVIGDGPLKIRPIIYRAVVSGNELIVNGIISTCHVGLPFDEDQFAPERFKLWGEVRASAVEIKLGTQPQEVPGNRHLFPEKAGHSLWCYFAARFPLTPEQKDRAAQAKLIRDVAVRIDGGRKILRGGVRTENPVYALEDILRDPLNGLGLPEAVIDEDAVESAASYVGTRFRGRFEISKPQPLLDFVMNFVGSFHGYVTFNDGLMQIGAKRHNEAPVAVFGTGGYPFVTDPKWSERDSSEIVNEVLFKYHNKVRKATKFVLYDKGLQIAAANHGPRNKAVTEEWYLQGIYDSNEAAIAAAIWMREEINLNAFITCTVELADYEESGVKVGDIIRVNSPHLVDPATNYLWRVIEDPEDTDEFTVTLTCQIYDGIVYSYSADPIGDIIRDGQEPSTGGRPPDMENCEAEVVEIFENENDPDDADDDSKDVRVRLRATYPDLTAQMEEDHEEGYAAEYPIIGWQVFYRFTDETALHYNRGVFVKYPETEGFQTLPYHRKKDVEFLFASVARNNATGEIGYVLDPTKTTFLDEDVDDTEPAIDVDDGSVFAGAVYARCEGEIMKITSVAGDTVTMEADGGERVPQFGSDALEHPEGTEIGVAKLSHPSVIVDMAVRKYKMKKVANVVARQRPKGVRVKWKNLARYDNEHYRVYWTFTDLLNDDADYVTDWVTEDPENPPDGVQVVPAGRQAHVLIPQEEIDAVYGSDASGVELKIRVAAYIKQNNSEELSDLANASHGNAPNGPPSTPKPGMWRFERVPGSERVKVFLKIGAKEETEPYTTTFEEQNMDLVGAMVEKFIKATSSWEGVLRKFGNSPHEVEDDTLASVEIMDTMHLGSKWRVRNCFGKNRGTKRKKSPDVTTAIFVVGDEQDDVDLITDLSIAAFGMDETTDSIHEDNQTAQLLVLFTQPSTPVGLRELQIRKKRDAVGVTKWRRVPALELTGRVDDAGNSFDTAGAKEVRIDVNHPKNAEMLFEVRLVAADGSVGAWEGVGATIPDDTGGGDLPIRDDANGPSYPTISHVVRNHLVGTPSISVVDFAYTPYADGSAADNAFGAPDSGFGPVRRVKLVFERRNAANTTGVGKLIRVSVDVDPEKGTGAAPFEVAVPGFDAGKRYRLLEIRYYNGTDEVSRVANAPNDPAAGVDFVAGASSYQYDATAISGGSLSYTQDDNRKADVTTSFTQPSVPVLLETATYEHSYDNGSTWTHIKARHLLGKAGKYSVGSAAVVIPETVHHKKNVSQYKIRVVLAPFGTVYETGDPIAAPFKALTSGAAAVVDDPAGADLAIVDSGLSSYATVFGTLVTGVVGDPAAGAAEASFTVATTGTFGTPGGGGGPIRQVWLTIEDSSGKEIQFGGPVAQAGSSVTFSHKVHLGGIYTLTKVRYVNGASVVEKTGTSAFLAGKDSYRTAGSGGSEIFTAATGYASGPSFVAAVMGAKERRLKTTLGYTQPATKPILLKSIHYEVDEGDGLGYQHYGREGVLADQINEAVVNRVVSQIKKIHCKKAGSVAVRAILVPFGSSYKVNTSVLTTAPNFSLTDSDTTDDGVSLREEHASGGNLIIGGDCTRATRVYGGDAVDTTLGKQFFFDANTTSRITTTSSPVSWDRTNHCIAVAAAGTRRIYIRVPALKLGMPHWLTVAVSSSGSATDLTGSIGLYNSAFGLAMPFALGLSLTGSLQITTTYQILAIRLIPTTALASGNAKCYVGLTVSSSAAITRWTNWCFVEGDKPQPFELAYQDYDVDSAPGVGYADTGTLSNAYIGNNFGNDGITTYGYIA